MQVLVLGAPGQRIGSNVPLVSVTVLHSLDRLVAELEADRGDVVILLTSAAPGVLIELQAALADRSLVSVWQVGGRSTGLEMVSAGRAARVVFPSILPGPPQFALIRQFWLKTWVDEIGVGLELSPDHPVRMFFRQQLLQSPRAADALAANGRNRAIERQCAKAGIAAPYRFVMAARAILGRELHRTRAFKVRRLSVEVGYRASGGLGKCTRSVAGLPAMAFSRTSDRVAVDRLVAGLGKVAIKGQKWP